MIPELSSLIKISAGQALERNSLISNGNGSDGRCRPIRLRPNDNVNFGTTLCSFLYFDFKFSSAFARAIAPFSLIMFKSKSSLKWWGILPCLIILANAIAPLFPIQLPGNFKCKPKGSWVFVIAFANLLAARAPPLPLSTTLSRLSFNRFGHLPLSKDSAKALQPSLPMSSLPCRISCKPSGQLPLASASANAPAPLAVI